MPATFFPPPDLGPAGDRVPGVAVSGAALAGIGLAIPAQRPLAAAVILVQAC